MSFLVALGFSLLSFLHAAALALSPIVSQTSGGCRSSGRRVGTIRRPSLPSLYGTPLFIDLARLAVVIQVDVAITFRTSAPVIDVFWSELQLL